MKRNSDLDSILDQALDDFDSLELSDKAANVAAERTAGGNSKQSGDEAELLKQQERAKMEALLASMQDPKYGETLQSTFRQLSGTAGGIESVDQLFDQLSKEFDQGIRPSMVPHGPNDIEGIENADREVNATLKMIGNAQKGMEGFEAGKLEEAGEMMMEDMMAEFETLGEKEDYNEVIDGVMRQLLSKDLMYEPTKQICEKFPEWLAIHK